MLKFIFGLPSSGKTTEVLNLIKEKVNKQKNVILIVPEQFSFQSEKSILQLLGDFDATKVKVVSFSRLYDEISNEIGGISGKLLSDGDKIILMNRVLNELKHELLIWGKYSNSLNFSKNLLDTIGEFKVNAITANDILKAAECSDKLSLKNKLHDLALIYQNFDAVLGEKFIDPVDKLTKVFRMLEKVKFFENKTVFFDSFKAFTGQQFKIIDRILNQAEDVYFAINNNFDNPKEFDLYSNIRQSVSKIEALAIKNRIRIEEPLILNGTKYSNEKLYNLERLMAGESINANLNDSVTVCKCNTAFDEAEFTARNIRRLIREKGYRYRDFVIIARDTERYQQAIEYACAKNDIVCFYDKRVGLNSLPFSFAVDAAISALDFSTQNVLRFHKCGFSKITTDELSKLENFTLLWNIDGDSWLNEWDMDPRGFGIKEMTETEYNELKEINRIREIAIKPLNNFKKEFYGNAKQRSTAIVNLLENADAKNTLSDLCKRFEEIESDISPDILKQGYRRFMSVLDSVVSSFGEQTLTKTEYYEALNLALSIETVAAVPQFLDEVSFGSADRIQPARAKVAFILGCNQGIFPKTSSSGGILSQNDRKKLIELNLQISDNSISAAIDENYLVYSNVCCANELVYLTYGTQNTKGEELMPSPFVSAICECLNPTLTIEPALELSLNSLPETEGAIFSGLCSRFDNPNSVATLHEALKTKGQYSQVFSAVNKNLNSISSENAEKLFGNYINLSATKIDTLNRCRFSYFCKYGMRAEKLQPAEFNVLQRGTIAHYVLEQIISQYKEKVIELSNDELDSLTDKYIEEYLNSVTGFQRIRDARFDFLIIRISRSLKEVVRHVANDFRQSDFKPVACEFKIGFNGDTKLEFPYDKGTIGINGSIDRVDKFNNYIRIVDYKTGSKKFKLPDIIYGLNMQMLIYLYALIRGQQRPDNDAAAILYMPASRDVKDEGLAMNGLIQAEPSLNTAMEKNNEGEFVPKLLYTQKGDISKKSTSYIEAKNFTEIFDHIERIMRKTGNLISEGDISVSPINGRESDACKYCDFKAICNVDETEIIKVPDLDNSEVFEILSEEE